MTAGMPSWIPWLFIAASVFGTVATAVRIRSRRRPTTTRLVFVAAMLGAGFAAGLSGLLGLERLAWLFLAAANLLAIVLFLGPMFSDRFD